MSWDGSTSCGPNVAENCRKWVMLAFPPISQWSILNILIWKIHLVPVAVSTNTNFHLRGFLAYVRASGGIPCVSWNISTVPLTQFLSNAVFSRNQNTHKSGNRCIKFWRNSNMHWHYYKIVDLHRTNWKWHTSWVDFFLN